MAILGSRNNMQGAKVIAAPWYACVTGGGTEKVPKGYVPMMLVDGEDDEHGQRILVQVKMLREPCVTALLELAEQQFGHGQHGVLRIPCTMSHFEHIVKQVDGLRKSR